MISVERCENKGLSSLNVGPPPADRDCTLIDTPLVTIVTPSYNQGEFLEQTIASVLNQEYPNIEYIVIDGGSTDGSIDIIRKYQDDLDYWESEPDRGQAHAINKGLSRATGDILGWVNSDDVLLPDAVSRAVAHLNEFPDVDVVYGRVNRIDSHGRFIPTPLLPKDTTEFNRKTAIADNHVNSAGACWRRGIMNRVGLLDESLHYVMDYEFWVRMVIAGATFRRIPGEPVANFRVAGHAKTVSQLEQSALEGLAVLDRFLADPNLADKLVLSPLHLKWQARRAKAYNRLRAFYGCFRQKGKRLDALRWLQKAVFLYPPILLERRWLLLATARLRRVAFS